MATLTKLNIELDAVGMKLDALFESLAECTYPTLRWNIEAGIEALSKKHTELSSKINALSAELS